MRILVVGQLDRDEMTPIRAWLRSRLSADQWRHAPTVAAATPERHPFWRPDLIVVLESHPDEYAVADVNRLFAFAPSARIVCCAGAWSESAGRNRKIWPVAIRVPAVNAVSRLEQEWSLLTGTNTVRPLLDGSHAPWFLPPTGSREEWFAANHPGLATAIKARRLAIDSPDAAWRQMISDLLVAAGHTVIAARESSSDIMVFDADPWGAERRDALANLAGHGPVIVLTNWPTADLTQALKNLGDSQIVAKLGDQNALLRAIDGVNQPQ